MKPHWERSWGPEKDSHMWELSDTEAVHIDWHNLRKVYEVEWQLADEYDKPICERHIVFASSIKLSKQIAEDWVQDARFNVIRAELDRHMDICCRLSRAMVAT